MALDIEAERMVVRQKVEDLSFSEVWAPPEAAEHVEVGDTVLHLDAAGRTLGWYLPARRSACGRTIGRWQAT